MLPLIIQASPSAPFEQVRTQLAALVAQGDLAPAPGCRRSGSLRRTSGSRRTRWPGPTASWRPTASSRRTAARARSTRSAVLDAGNAVPDAGGVAGPGAADRARAAAEAYVASVRTLGLGVSEATRLVELAWARS